MIENRIDFVEDDDVRGAELVGMARFPYGQALTIPASGSEVTISSGMNTRARYVVANRPSQYHYGADGEGSVVVVVTVE